MFQGLDGTQKVCGLILVGKMYLLPTIRMYWPEAPTNKDRITQSSDGVTACRLRSTLESKLNVASVISRRASAIQQNNRPFTFHTAGKNINKLRLEKNVYFGNCSKQRISTRAFFSKLYA